MCLDITYDNPNMKYPKGKTYIGYKVVYRSIDTLVNASVLAQPTKFKPNKWITDQHNYKLDGEVDGRSYQTGFHMYKTINAAKGYGTSHDEIWKVEFRDVVATGYQDNKQVIVARKIRLIERIK